jgi:hypothetical protein
MRPCAISESFDSAFHFRRLCAAYYTMFRPNRPSVCVQVVVLKESAARCNAVMLFLCSLE